MSRLGSNHGPQMFELSHNHYPSTKVFTASVKLKFRFVCGIQTYDHLILGQTSSHYASRTLHTLVYMLTIIEYVWLAYWVRMLRHILSVLAFQGTQGLILFLPYQVAE